MWWGKSYTYTYQWNDNHKPVLQIETFMDKMESALLDIHGIDTGDDKANNNRFQQGTPPISVLS